MHLVFLEFWTIFFIKAKLMGNKHVPPAFCRTYKVQIFVFTVLFKVTEYLALFRYHLNAHELHFPFLFSACCCCRLMALSSSKNSVIYFVMALYTNIVCMAMWLHYLIETNKNSHIFKSENRVKQSNNHLTKQVIFSLIQYM